MRIGRLPSPISWGVSGVGIPARVTLRPAGGLNLNCVHITGWEEDVRTNISHGRLMLCWWRSLDVDSLRDTMYCTYSVLSRSPFILQPLAVWVCSSLEMCSRLWEHAPPCWYLENVHSSGYIMRGDNVCKLMFGCNYRATTQTVKILAAYVTGHMGKRQIFCIPCEIQVRYRVNSCSVLFLNLEYISCLLHDFRREWPQLKPNRRRVTSNLIEWLLPVFPPCLLGCPPGIHASLQFGLWKSYLFGQ